MVTYDNINSVLRLQVEANLEKIDKKNINQRNAYLSGVYFVLILSLANEEMGRPKVDPQLWKTLTSKGRGCPSTSELLREIEHCSYGKFVLEESLIPNSGLRLGRPGDFYSLAIRETLYLCIIQVPGFFSSGDPAAGYKPTVAWIYRQMKYIESLMELG